MAKGGKPGGGGGTSATTIKGTRGDDKIVIGEPGYPDNPSGFIIDGSAGNDYLQGGSGPDRLIGGSGDDTLVGAMDDLESVSASTLVYDGGRGADTLDLSRLTNDIGVDLSSSEQRILLGVSFNADGGLFRDVTWTDQRAISGIENVIGGSGNDYLAGDWGNNRLEGGAGDDYISSGSGNDILSGGDGNDLLNCGWGDNVLTGGSGNDTFAITGRVAGQYVLNVITDFETKTESSDTSFDQIYLWEGWSIQWIDNGGGPLTGYLLDGGEIFGEVTISNLSYENRALVPVYQVDSATGDPIIGDNYASADQFASTALYATGDYLFV